MGIIKFIIPEIIFGTDALSQIGVCAKRLGANKVLVVSDKGVKEAGWVDKGLDHLEKADLSYYLWDEVTPNPSDKMVNRGGKLYHEQNCDAVVAIGGGSVIDTAKAVALLASNGGEIQEYEGIDKVVKPLPPLVAAATTAGSGAEVSQFCIILDSSKKSKMSIVSKSLVPDIAISDPALLSTKSFELTANTGMDALTHAIEAYTSIAATPLTDVNAINAVELISKNLRKAASQKTDIQAQEAMAMASLQAGKAFSNAILGAVHAMAHQLGGLLNMPHGEVNAVLLPHVMRFNLISCLDRYSDIARAFGIIDKHLSERELAEQAIKSVETLAEDINVPKNLKSLGVEEEHIHLLSENAVKDVCLITNSREADYQDIKEIFTRAYSND